MPFLHNSSELSKNNSRNITHMAVLVFREFEFRAPNLFLDINGVCSATNRGCYYHTVFIILDTAWISAVRFEN